MSRVLVVDDNVLGREGTAAVLRSAGHDVLVATTASEADAALASNVFDVVLTDLQLPDRTGWDVAASARARHTGVRILIMTGWDLRAEEHDLSGVERLFYKPIDPEDLIAAI